MLSKKAVRPIKTTAGIFWVTGRIIDGEFRQDHYTKYYKKKSTALKSIKRK